ncbi:hypothetical protein E1212_21970 [Jiangella ureilytica]|uniref:Phospholipase n=1 Tax=Jiangella ureilytica TaxID=2530374 RepID=A0A4R4RFZ2_9ACTN|nr:phospholipase A2 [Jiangella ureilytica]TDC48190.1 hypothetical protein E1212_21970 [Jiangella ureilytica]
MWTRIALVAAAVAASFALTGAGWPASPAPAEDPAAAHAVRVLTGGSASAAQLAAALPADFAAVEGYQPVAVPGPDGAARLVDPAGGCSWLGSTSYDFGPACRAHDLGYDLLRYATAKGGALGPWARHAVDDRFAADLRERCAAVSGGAACAGLARATVGAVGFNSWRQGYGNPGDEAVWPYLLSGVLIAAAAAAPSLVRRVG